MSVGVIGLGLMGGGMASRLVERGHTVLGFDPDERSRSIARGNGIILVDTVEELCSEPRAVLTSLPNSSIVRDVWLRPGGLAEKALPGSILLEVSTIDPATMKEVAAAVRDGVGVLDAPVSGGPVEARSGTLTFLLGGDADLISRADAILPDLSTTVHHAGRIGDAKIVKIANNVMSATNTLVAAESFSTAVAAGMDARRLFEILAKSGGTSSQFVKRFPWALEGDFSPRFTVALAAKDLGLALDMARSVGMPSPMTAAAREMYQMAISHGKAGDDMVVFTDLYRSWADAR